MAKKAVVKKKKEVKPIEKEMELTFTDVSEKINEAVKTAVALKKQKQAAGTNILRINRVIKGLIKLNQKQVKGSV